VPDWNQLAPALAFSNALRRANGNMEDEMKAEKDVMKGDMKDKSKGHKEKTKGKTKGKSKGHMEKTKAHKDTAKANSAVPAPMSAPAPAPAP
jgi:hypothetical protein